MSMNTKHLGGFLVLAALAVVGCAPPAEETASYPPIKQRQPFTFNVDAGAPVAPSNDTIMRVAASKRFVSRTDPFALNPSQRAFELQQQQERILQDLGGFYGGVEFPEEVDVVPTVQQPPYRRLAGVVVGQSVLGIIEMEDGRTQTVVRPGMMLPGTEWRVISIDANRAVLRRAGNVLPREISVRLEVRPPGFGQAPGGPGPGGDPTQGGRPGGPGGRPGGSPGAPGMDAPPER